MNRTLKILFTLVVLLVFLGAAFFVLNSYIYTEKQEPNPVVSYRGELLGTFVCVPKRDGTASPAEECVQGLRTDAGEYYAVDFMLLSQEVAPQLAVHEKFSAQGLITPAEMLSADHWRQYPIAGIFSVTDSLTREVYACDADAKICPDGSPVGRSGPKCEFAPCPNPDAAVSRVSTFLGGSATALNITVNPKALVSDSRCPEGVQCIWAGTVEVQTVLSSAVAHGEHVLKLNEPQPFGDYLVTLKDVTPAASGEAIPESSYRFLFEIARK